MFIDKNLIPVMRFMFIFGIPILLFGIGIFFMTKIFFMPAFSSGRKRQKSTEASKVLGKREEVLMNPNAIVTLYFVTFDLGNDILELMVPKSYYKDFLNYSCIEESKLKLTSLNMIANKNVLYSNLFF